MVRQILMTAVWLLACGSAALAQGLPQARRELAGPDDPALRAAMPEFAKLRQDIANYRIVAADRGATVVVVFIDREAKPNCLGNCGRRPGLEVELRSSDLAVIRAYRPR